MIDSIARWVARHLPQRIRYWVFIQLGVEHIQPNEIVPEMEYTKILARIRKG